MSNFPMLGLVPTLALCVACSGDTLPAAPDDSDPGEQGRAAPVVTTVSVAPDSVELFQGDTAVLEAVILDQYGEAIDAAATWGSSDGAVVTVEPLSDGRSLVRAVAPGSAIVTVQVESVTSSASVLAEPRSDLPPGSLTSECEAPADSWIWCDDFELNRLDSYFEYNDANGDFVRSESAGVEGSVGMRAIFAPGQVSAGSLHLAMGRTPQAYFRPVDEGTADYREIYWRVFIRNQDGWVGGGGNKLSRAFVFASEDSWAQAMIGHVWSGGEVQNRDFLFLDPASGTDAAGRLITTRYNDFENLRWLGARGSQRTVFSDQDVGQWFCVEARVRLNDPGSENGVFQLWIDGESQVSIEALNWLGDFDSYGLNAVFLENYWNDGSPAEQERFFDNFVVSTQPIGCGPQAS